MWLAAAALYVHICTWCGAHCVSDPPTSKVRDNRDTTNLSLFHVPGEEHITKQMQGTEDLSLQVVFPSETYTETIVPFPLRTQMPLFQPVFSASLGDVF